MDGPYQSHASNGIIMDDEVITYNKSEWRSGTIQSLWVGQDNKSIGV